MLAIEVDPADTCSIDFPEDLHNVIAGRQPDESVGGHRPPLQLETTARRIGNSQPHRCCRCLYISRPGDTGTEAACDQLWRRCGVWRAANRVLYRAQTIVQARSRDRIHWAHRRL